MPVAFRAEDCGVAGDRRAAVVEESVTCLLNYCLLNYSTLPLPFPSPREGTKGWVFPSGVVK